MPDDKFNLVFNALVNAILHRKRNDCRELFGIM